MELDTVAVAVAAEVAAVGLVEVVDLVVAVAISCRS